MVTGRTNFVVVLIFLGSTAPCVEAQHVAIPQRAYAIGLNTTAGYAGVEWVARSFSMKQRLGGAAGVGIFGAGVRLNLALRDSQANDRVPYLAAGLAFVAWFPMLDGPRTVGSVEAGMQIWSRDARKLYVDVGAGAGFEMGSSGDPIPAVRIVAGRTL